MREDGYIVWGDAGSDRVIEAGTLQCVHCGIPWIAKPGSGAVRGFCQNCAGPVCGPSCVDCVPIEQLLENLEAGRPEHFRRIIVPTCG